MEKQGSDIYLVLGLFGRDLLGRQTPNRFLAAVGGRELSGVGMKDEKSPTSGSEIEDVLHYTAGI